MSLHSFHQLLSVTILIFFCITSSDALRMKDRKHITLRNDGTSAPADSKRPLSFLELQPHLLWYSAAVSSIAPVVWGSQLARLNPKAGTSLSEVAMLSLSIIPVQTILKMLQLNAGTPITRHLNPWVSFAVMGVIQGGVTGQANVFFSRALGIGAPKLAHAFRGYPLAAAKEIVAQGLPFAFSDFVHKKILDPLLPSSSASSHRSSPSFVASCKRTLAVFATTALGSAASQVCNNVQFAMIANPSLSYAAAFSHLWSSYGLETFYQGTVSRTALMMLVNVLNDVILKRAWGGHDAPTLPHRRARANWAKGRAVISPRTPATVTLPCSEGAARSRCKWSLEQAASAA